MCCLLSIYVGVITSEPSTLLPLLHDLARLADGPSVERVVAVILDNASPGGAMRVVHDAASVLRPLELVVVDIAQQRRDASRGCFGEALFTRPEGQASIAAARTMLQRYLGAMMSRRPGSFVWLLDDDMRLDARAREYVSWLPRFREDGVDVLLGAFEGSSPNPPLHGVQGQLFDLLHNLRWLRSLPSADVLPDRTAENAAQRERFPDYYYDLSRKHAAHLSEPFWIEPATQGERVGEAYARMIQEAPKILSGAPLTRPLVARMPHAPLLEATDSVNRGGHTFVLNPRALTETPNAMLRLGAREARRSDMLWAIINRYYRGMSIKAVGFPVLHVERAKEVQTLDTEKVAAELVGAALYAALTEFLASAPEHGLAFSRAELEDIGRMVARHRQQRLDALRESFARIEVLREALRQEAQGSELDAFLTDLAGWFSSESFEQICIGARSPQPSDVEVFLGSLRAVADDYASAASVNIEDDFFIADLRS